MKHVQSMGIGLYGYDCPMGNSDVTVTVYVSELCVHISQTDGKRGIDEERTD